MKLLKWEANREDFPDHGLCLDTDSGYELCTGRVHLLRSEPVYHFGSKLERGL